MVELIEQPDSSALEISDAVGRDPGLAARVLKLANSVFHGFASQISSLERAVQIIGLEETRALVLDPALGRMDDLVVEGLDVPEFWDHSVLCATAAALLAGEFNHPEPERLFVGGLLHDIGRLMIALHAPEPWREVVERCQREGELSLNVERLVLGFDHATVGAELIASWQMPKPLAHMVRWHHNPGKAPNPQLDTFLVHYADFITSVLGLGDGGERLICPLTVPNGLKAMVLPDDRLELLAQELLRQEQELRTNRRQRLLPMAQSVGADPAGRVS